MKGKPEQHILCNLWLNISQHVNTKVKTAKKEQNCLYLGSHTNDFTKKPKAFHFPMFSSEMFRIGLSKNLAVKF